LMAVTFRAGTGAFDVVETIPAIVPPTSMFEPECTTGPG